MSPRAARVLAWSVWTLALVLVAGPVGQIGLNSFGPTALLFWGGFLGVQLCAASAGLVITLHHPGHAVGWIFLAMGAGLGLILSMGVYADLGIRTSAGPLPGDDAAAWLAGWLFIPIAFGLPLCLLLLFPSGYFLSARWRVGGWMIGVVVLAACVASAFEPGRYDSTVTIENPLGASGGLGTVMTELEAVTSILALPVFLGAVAGLVARFRRADEVERLQLKWFSYAGALVGVGLAGTVVIPGGWPADVLFLIGLLGLLGLPLAAGVAILRYRLYDIDVVINKTLVYGGLTATLGAAYLGMVLLLQWAVSPLTADSGLAVAASTLAVAALFRPVRSRIQALVDRRFYRRRYDAARTLEAFGVRLRDELDLQSIGDDVRGVVQQTMQPAHVSLWLREAPR
ncbi:MAG: hypothetical protein ACRDOY_07615 [Nocardioidaceae bacterium]